MKIRMPEYVKRIIRTLEDRGYEAYIVGGCVRDGMLGRQPEDWDVCTSATPEEIKESFSDVKTVDTGIRHGTVTVVIDHEPVEVTTFRTDGKYSDGRHPDKVQFTKD